MTPRLIRIATYLILLLQFSDAWAQQLYPVQVRPTVRSASVLLADYEEPSNFSVQIRMNDLSVSTHRIRLKVKFSKDNKVIESRYGIDLELSGGQTYMLNRRDLRELLDYGNLEYNGGIHTNEDNIRILSEGFWRISFRAYDANTGIPISNDETDFVTVSVNLNDPPFLNTPHNVSMLDPNMAGSSIMFTWTPRSIISSPSISVKYRMRMVRVEPVDRNPYDAILTGSFELDNRPFSNLTTPVFLWDQNMFPLEPGAIYAWQVQAYEEIMVDGQIINSSARFRNQGESEVFTFSIKESCNQVSPYRPEVSENKDQVVLRWPEDENHTQYEIKYRPMSTEQPWKLDYTEGNELVLTKVQLEPGVTYEYMIRAKCNNWLDPVYGGLFTLPVIECPPPAPLYISANNEEGIHLNWEDVSSANAYNIRYQHNAGNWEEIINHNGTTFTLPNIEEGQYNVRVDAVCGTETGIGEEQTIAHDDEDYVGDCPVPEPLTLVVSSIGAPDGGLANASWSSLPVHESYEFVYRHRDSLREDVHNAVVAEAPGIVAHPGQLYKYSIKYNCANGKSSMSPLGWFRVDDVSEEDVVTDPPTANCFPPSGTSAEPRSETKARFEWLGVSGANEYQLFYAPHGTEEWELFTTTQKFAKITDLEPGGQYDYKVRCRCGSDFSIFSDIGFLDMDMESERRCDTIPFFIVRNVTETEVQLAWAFEEDKNGYWLAYKEESQSWDDPYIENLNNIETLLTSNFSNDTLRFTVGNLEPGATYHFRLQGKCGTDNAKFNGPLSATTVGGAEEEDSECGVPGACDRSVTDHIESIAVDDTIYVADSYMVIKSVDGPSNNLWSGTSISAAPFFGLNEHIQLASSFENLHINSKKCVVDGTVSIDSVNMYLLDESTRQYIKDRADQLTDLIDSATDLLNQVDDGLGTAGQYGQQAQDYFQGGSNTGRVVTGELRPQVTVDRNIGVGDISVEGGQLRVAGETQSASLPALVRDSEDEVFSVSPEGEVVRVGQYEPGFEQPSDTLSDLDFRVSFKENTSLGIYGFDEFQPIYGEKVAMRDYYLKLGDDYFSAKAIVPSAVDYVDFELSGNADPSKLRFVNREGFVFEHSGNTITLAGGPENDAQEVFAMYNDGEEDKLIGALLLASYPVVTKKVVLVPVKSDYDFDKNLQDIEAKVNEVFGKVGMRYTVELDNSFADNTDWCDMGVCEFSPSRSQRLSNDYTGKEKAIRDAYVNFKDPDNLDPEAAYLFAIAEPIAPYEDEDLQGKMAFGKQFGFLFNVERSSEQSLGRILAHELGHGNFMLRHIFANQYLGDAAKYSDNVMSIKAGPSAIDLIKLQWDIIHDPGVTWGIFSRDEDQQYSGEEYFQKLLQLIRCAYASGDEEISMPHKYRLGLNGKLVNFEYSLNSLSLGELEDLKFNSARLYCPPADVIILKDLEVNEHAGYIKFGNFKMVLKAESFSADHPVTPFEHFKRYLLPERQEIYEEYQELIRELEGKESLSKADIEKVKAVANCDAQYFSVYDRYLLISHILDYPNFITAYYEDLVLDLLVNYTGSVSDYANEMLEYLNIDYPLLGKMFNFYNYIPGGVWNEDNYERFLSDILMLWQESEFSNPDKYSYHQYVPISANKPVYSPRVVSPTGRSWFPKVEYTFIDEFKRKRLRIKAMTFDRRRTSYLEYDYFQPVTIVFEKNNTSKIVPYDVPAIFYAGIVDSDNLAVKIEKVSFAVDIALLFTGVGNLPKLRHLTGLHKWGRIVLGGLDITSDCADIILSYTSFCEGRTEFCESFKEYNDYLKLALLGSGYIDSKFFQSRRNAYEQYRINRSNISNPSVKEKLDYHFRDLSANLPEGRFRSVRSTVDYPTKIQQKLIDESIQPTKFTEMVSKAVEKLSQNDFNTIKRIRTAYDVYDNTKTFQRVISRTDLYKYISGELSNCDGYITSLEACGHYSTFDDYFYGLRLDKLKEVEGGNYSFNDGSIGVIRFKANNSDKLNTPSCNVPDNASYSCHGFTQPLNGRLTAPVWRVDECVDMQDGAEIWEISSDGSEILRAVYSKGENKFNPVP
ncbi:hypothetical protein RCC89_02050 [Cytophagaceae bacterium ABcell3]|nr:hypothetical protein RCC89_02050 [Cytophagaceae bacterium ABcell3]